MSETIIYTPPRQRGLLFHGILIVALGTATVLTFLLGAYQHIGSYFVLLLLISLLLFAPLPLIIYRAYALARANYRLERDGLRLRWGLRAEDIPLPDVEWVRQASDLAVDLPLPRLSTPGAVLGTVRVQDLGPVEYLASGKRTLVLIATTQKVYAISPEDPQAFISDFQHSLELGSLTPLSSVSVLPAAYLSQVWTNRVARVLILLGFVLNLLLFVGVSLIIPGRGTVSLGFYPNGAALPGVPAEQLILLPILGVFSYLIDLSAGLFFFRREKESLVAFIVWGSSVMTTVLLILAVFFILTR